MLNAEFTLKAKINNYSYNPESVSALNNLLIVINHEKLNKNNSECFH